MNDYDLYYLNSNRFLTNLDVRLFGNTSIFFTLLTFIESNESYASFG